MRTLKDLRQELINSLAGGEVLPTIKLLKSFLHLESDSYVYAILLQSRYKKNERDRNFLGVISDEKASIEFNQIQVALLELINSLPAQDLNIEIKEDPKNSVELATKETNKGTILYKIPNVMQVKKAQKCFVRIAFDERLLPKTLAEKKGIVREKVRVADLMEIKLTAIGNEALFNIQPLTNIEQIVDKDDYTEWIFFVTSLQPGIYELYLKVTIIEFIHNDREVKRDIVLNKKIEVVTEDLPTTSYGEKTKDENTILAGALFASPNWEGFEKSHYQIDISKPLLKTGMPIAVEYLSSLGFLLFIIWFLFHTCKEEPHFAPIEPLTIQFEEKPTSYNVSIDGGVKPYQLWVAPASLVRLINRPKKWNLGDSSQISIPADYLDIDSGDTLKVIDSLHSIAHTIVRLKTPPEISCQYNQDYQTIELSIFGETPPFHLTVFRDTVTIFADSIRYDSTFSIPFESTGLKKTVQLTSRVIDNFRKEGICTEVIEPIKDYEDTTTITLPPKPPKSICSENPIKWTDVTCMDLDLQTENCYFLYIFKGIDRDNWLMKEKVFNNCEVRSRVNGNIIPYRLNINNVSPNCVDIDLSPFKDSVGLYIYNAKEKTLKRQLGVIPSKKFLETLKGCKTEAKPNRLKGDFRLKLPTDATYQVLNSTEDTEIAFKRASAGYTIQVAAFSEPEVCRIFLEKLKEQEKEHPIFIRIEKNQTKVFVGYFGDDEIAAEQFRKEKGNIYNKLETPFVRWN